MPAKLHFNFQLDSNLLPDAWPLSLSRMRRLIVSSLPQQCLTAEISLIAAGTQQAQQLNRQYRGKDYATNVLTFVYQGLPEIKADLVICRAIAAKEAQNEGKPLDHHLAHLLVHGVLHASGLDHEEDSEAHAMESLEIAILKRFRIPNPYLSTGR
jgi:probable rRNA maturation factor